MTEKKHTWKQILINTLLIRCITPIIIAILLGNLFEKENWNNQATVGLVVILIIGGFFGFIFFLISIIKKLSKKND